MKKIIFILCTFSLVNTGFAQKTVFPPFGVFSEMEKIVSVDITPLLVMDINFGLSKQELQKLITITKEGEEIMNRDWQTIYIGFIKRVEARMLFNTASAVSHQPGFSTNQELLKTAFNFLNNGFKYLNQYSSSIYPPYIITDTKWTHDDEAGVRTETSTMAKIRVDETKPQALLAYVNELLGNNEEALTGYYTVFGDNVNMEPQNSEMKVSYPYTLADHILYLAGKTKKYDQQLLNFCLMLLRANYGTYDGQKTIKTGESLTLWNALEPRLLKSIDQVANTGTQQKYFFYLGEEGADKLDARFDWMIPILYKFDSKNMMGTLGTDIKTDAGKNRFVFELIHVCSNLIDMNPGSPYAPAARAILDKHFNEIVILAKVWFRHIDMLDCRQLQWIAEHADKYKVEASEKNWLDKRMKKCKKEMHW